MARGAPLLTIPTRIRVHTASLYHSPTTASLPSHTASPSSSTPKAAARSSADALQRVGSKSPLSDFLRLLLAYAQPTLLPSEVVAALLDLSAGIIPSAAGDKTSPGAAAGRQKGQQARGSGRRGRRPGGEDEEEDQESEEDGSDEEEEEGDGGKQRRRGTALHEGDSGPVADFERRTAYSMCQRVSKSCGGLFARQVVRLQRMLERGDDEGDEEDGGRPSAATEDLQVLGAQLIARWACAAAKLSRGGAVAAAAGSPQAAGTAAAAAPRDKRASARSGGKAAGEGEEQQEGGAGEGVGPGGAAAQGSIEDRVVLEELKAPLTRVASQGVPKAAKHAVVALHFLYGASIVQVGGLGPLRVCVSLGLRQVRHLPVFRRALVTAV